MNLRDLTEEEKMLIAEFRLCSEADKAKILYSVAQQDAQPRQKNEHEQHDS